MLTLKKYFDQVIDVDISFETERHMHLAEVTVHASGIHLRAIGEGADFFAAIDDAEHKLERQLKKYKGRLMKHRQRRQKYADQLKTVAPMTATHHDLAEDDLEAAPEDIFADYIPTIKHKKVQDISPMSVDEAVMQMDLLHKPAFLFQNAKTGKLNVVYREGESTVRWVEPGAL